MPAPARPIVGSLQATGYEHEHILIRVLHTALFAEGPTWGQGERRTAGDRWEPLGSDGLWTKCGAGRAAQRWLGLDQQAPGGRG
jgi:hypothetical protein